MQLTETQANHCSSLGYYRCPAEHMQMVFHKIEQADLPIAWSIRDEHEACVINFVYFDADNLTTDVETADQLYKIVKALIKLYKSPE